MASASSGATSPKVVTVEIRVAAKSDSHAENAILALLAQAKDGTDFNVDEFQVVGIADDFSDEAKAYNAELGEPSWRREEEQDRYETCREAFERYCW